MIPAGPAHRHHLRDDVEALLDRLARIETHRVILRAAADSLSGAETSATLAHVLVALERDLALTARQVDHIHERAAGKPTP